MVSQNQPIINIHPSAILYKIPQSLAVVLGNDENCPYISVHQILHFRMANVQHRQDITLH